MIVLSFNCRGFSSTSKKLELKIMFLNHCHDVIKLQETLGDGDDVKLALNKMLPGWKFMTVDAKGRSRGLSLGVKACGKNLLNSLGLKMVLGTKVYS